VTDGGTLWLVAPKDDGVFRETQKVGEFTLACDAQIYLDLVRAGLRGPEQAQALREWSGFGELKREQVRQLRRIPAAQSGRRGSGVVDGLGFIGTVSRRLALVGGLAVKYLIKPGGGCCPVL